MKIRLIQKLTTLTILSLGFVFQNTEAQNYSLYGVTIGGGSSNKGVLYRYTYPSGKDTVIVNFDGINGDMQRGCLIIASDRHIYGMTSKGGTSNEGVLYRVNPKTYQDTILINFNGTNGANPMTGLVQASNGLLYGMTSGGGTFNMGLFFSYDIVTKTQTVLFSFDGTNGENPTGHCIQATNGLIYGHTTLGGTYGYGTIFYYNITTGHDSVVYNFNGSDGNSPRGFMQASNGLIYGNTYMGGTSNFGVIYSFDPTTNIYTVLLNLTGSNGIYPSGDGSSLFESSTGLLYGIAQMGGTYNHGVLFTYDINTAKDSILIDFSPTGFYGKDPNAAGYVQIPGGLLINPMDSGGTYGMGTLLSYDPTSGLFKKLLDFNDTNGAYPTSDLVFIENISEGINTIQNNNDIKLFPNPNKGIFTLYQKTSGDDSHIEIYNMLGAKIYTQYIPSSSKNTIININSEPKGIYLYRLLSSDGSQVSSGKFILE